ncbi:hypothetical protein TrVFT333_005260 [Trichoderma virens FT-333]|nr:hypothetical protein TrVFT333_005260 [Trichoderma virens FT-333]
MQQWADAAKEYPEWWTQSLGDDLLSRRTKMRLRNEYGQFRKDKGKERAIEVPQAFAAASSCEQWPDHHETSGTFSSLAGTFESLPGSSLESFSNSCLGMPNSNIHHLSSTTSGQVWGDGLGERFSTTRGFLRTADILDPGQEVANTASASTMHPNLGYQPDFWKAYEPPQPLLTVEQVWGVEDGDTTQSIQPQHEATEHTAHANSLVLDLDDPFWNIVLASGDDLVLDTGMNLDQTSGSNPAHYL